MANPLASIWDDIPETKPVSRPQPKPRVKRDFPEGRAIYEAFLQKKAQLEHLREYAKRVVAATKGGGMTPVMPLATMNHGAALLCDYCRKPMILECGEFDGVPVDEAWRRNPNPGWRSFIKGGMVVEIEENGTLRIYHGYPGIAKYCCEKVKLQKERDIANYRRDQEKITQLVRFLEEEFPEAELNTRLSEIVDVMFSYDPGFGVNQP